MGEDVDMSAISAFTEDWYSTYPCETSSVVAIDTSCSHITASVRTHRPIPMPTSLHIVAIHTRRRVVVEVALRCLLLPVVVHVFDVECVDMLIQRGKRVSRCLGL